MQVVPLPCGVDLRQHQPVRLTQHGDKIIKQRGGAGIGVGLEGHNKPLVGQRADGVQQRLYLIGMVIITVGAGDIYRAGELLLKRGDAE